MAEEEQKKVEETEATSAAKPEAVEAKPEAAKASKEAKPEAAKASKEAKPEAAKASKEVKPEAEGKEEKKAEGKTDDGPAPAEAPSAAELLSMTLDRPRSSRLKDPRTLLTELQLFALPSTIPWSLSLTCTATSSVGHLQARLVSAVLAKVLLSLLSKLLKMQVVKLCHTV